MCCLMAVRANSAGHMMMMEYTVGRIASGLSLESAGSVSLWDRRTAGLEAIARSVRIWRSFPVVAAALGDTPDSGVGNRDVIEDLSVWWPDIECTEGFELLDDASAGDRASGEATYLDRPGD